MTIQRISSGIPGLDKLIEGGYLKNSVILVSGGPGTGKTTFALQYIYNGAKEGEPGVYVSFEQESEHLKSSAKRFGMDFDKFEKQKKVVILRIKDVKDITDVLKIIDKNVKKVKAKRLVIDSLSSLEIFASTFKSLIRDIPAWALKERLTVMPTQQTLVRRLMYKIIDHFKSLGVTTLLTSESEDAQHSRSGVVEYVVDGIISLSTSIIGRNFQRNLVIIKMRDTDMEGIPHEFEITKKGIKVI